MRPVLLAVCFITIATAQDDSRIHFNSMSREVIEQRLAAYTIKNAGREPAVRRLFEDAGCKDANLTVQKVKGAKAPNLICTRPGETDSVILVGAHFDLTGSGHGVVDNWSGASLLSSLYEGLLDRPRKHTFVFVAFTEEEKGLIGSKFYASKLGKEKALVKAMINLDSLGLSETKVWSSHSDKTLLDWMGGLANAMKLPVTGVNMERVGSTDSESFRLKKIPVLSVHSITQQTFAILHTSRDNIEAIQLDEYYRTYRLVLAYLALLDQKLD